MDNCVRSWNKILSFLSALRLDPAMASPFSPRLLSIPSIPCTALFSRHAVSSLDTTVTGCATESLTIAHTAPLYPILSQEDLTLYLSAPPPHSSTAVLSQSLLTTSTLTSLSSHSITSFLIIPSPQHPHSPKPQTPYNPAGDAALLLDLHGIPMSYITDDEAADEVVALATRNVEQGSP